MSTNYETLYSKTPDALGAPFPEIVDWFAAQPAPLSVLDLGAGQGRDALFLARAGHQVTAVDISPSGVAQIADVARLEGLKIAAQVADLTQFDVAEMVDVVLADRTLHMLDTPARLALVDRLIPYARKAFLIADERKNLPQIEGRFDVQHWTTTLRQKGFLFLEA